MIAYLMLQIDYLLLYLKTSGTSSTVFIVVLAGTSRLPC